jgi:hypothetical protein
MNIGMKSIMNDLIKELMVITTFIMINLTLVAILYNIWPRRLNCLFRKHEWDIISGKPLCIRCGAKYGK